MTEDVDVVEKNALETVPVSLDAFLRVLVDGLVDEAVRAHEAAEACGPLVSSTPTALATDEGEGVSEVASEADRDDRGEDRGEDARENVDRRVEDEPARLESRGFSPEHAAAVDAVGDPQRARGRQGGGAVGLRCSLRTSLQKERWNLGMRVASSRVALRRDSRPRGASDVRAAGRRAAAQHESELRGQGRGARSVLSRAHRTTPRMPRTQA